MSKTAEGTIDVGRGIELCWEGFGDPAAPALVLIAGLGQQLLSWPDPFCEGVAAQGFHVIRFDNRDAGLSTRVKGVRPPGFKELATRRFSQQQYDLADMAQDTANLITGLELAPAHLVGISMGGMIGQTVAARHPEIVRSLTSIMSTSGGRRVGQPAYSTLPLLLAPAKREREAAVASTARVLRHIGSKGFPFDEERVRTMVGAAFDRAHNPAGTGRHMGAILKSGNRAAELKRITAPTLVIHGDRDRMVHPSGGKATAKAVPGARLVTIPGFGHDLPVALFPRLTELITAHAAAADAVRAPAASAA